MNKALLDTDIYSDILKAINQTVTRNATAYRLAMGRLSLSVVTVMEIIQGLQKVGASPKRIQRNGLELVTGNTAHYQRIQRLGYSITLLNWRI